MGGRSSAPLPPPPPLVRAGSAGAIARLLSSSEWQALNSASQAAKGGTATKLLLIAAAGLPPMQLISAVQLRKLGRFPANREGYAEDARGVLAGGGAVIMFFSHRWLRPVDGFPDDEQHSKLTALLSFSDSYERKYPGRQIYFWIDYTCIAWDNRETGIAALPAYVAACTDLVIFLTNDYTARAWCRLELAVAYSFMFAGEVPWVIQPGFAAQRGPLHALGARSIALLDPRDGAVTVVEDLEHICSLLEIARQSTAAAAWGGAARTLVFGADGTTVQAVMLLDSGSSGAPSPAGSLEASVLGEAS